MGITILVLCLGIIAILIGAVMVMVAAFRESVLWGLAYLFLPFANIVFIIIHWGEAKAGFLVSLAGLAAVLGIVFTFQGSTDVWQKAQALLVSSYLQAPAAGEQPEQQLAKIQETRDHIARLEGEFDRTRPDVTRQFNELANRRQALGAADAAAIAKFNDDAASYQKLNAERKQMAAALRSANQELSVLLAEQAKSAKRIVMYTTSTCGACKVAKSFFAQKGISYEEIDVTTSPEGAAEFKRLGGRGVPLILVGDKRMEGFNPQALEAML